MFAGRPVRRPLAVLRLLAAVGAVFCLGGAACAPSIPRVTPADASRAGADFETLSLGRNTYVANCGGCHRLARPGQHTAHEWARRLPEMAGEAKLTPAEAAAVRTYLLAFAAPALAGNTSPPSTTAR